MAELGVWGGGRLWCCVPQLVHGHEFFFTTWVWLSELLEGRRSYFRKVNLINVLVRLRIKSIPPFIFVE